ncbi:putative aminoacyltransferase, E1 ubiquitin-activating enzyme [Rosa chinensis]|uniref:RING-type E3 ubiquitin transferase n=1 Tax=Rosa chinensis TaxID=74649 RepID=A0A2P6PH07_ROSCH|nr:putative aminoacyltransferase, E1 ubiquitin-activating enzyme [Rosa chinensis]
MPVWDVIEGEEIRVRVPGEEICSVCLEEFRSRPPCVAMPCSHVFHSECIRTWLGRRNERSCPLCRFQMPTIVEPSITYMFHLGLNLA